MKRNAGLYIILASFVVTTTGSVLKIKHAGGADIFLAIGVISFIVGIVLILLSLFKKQA